VIQRAIIYKEFVLVYCISSTGINMVKRKLASHDNLKITVQQTGDKFNLKEVSAFRTVDIEFTLGVTFSYTMADGTELTVSTIILNFSLYNLKNKGSVLASMVPLRTFNP